MFKKIVIALVAFMALMLCGWKLFFSEGQSVDEIKKLNTDMSSYHMEANMEIGQGEEIKKFYVSVDFKNEDEDLFKISLLDKDINQEQILLKNKEGVFVLTPVLNQVYTFDGDYPLNSPKPYLYHSFVDSLKGNYDVTTLSDGYLVSYKVVYDNEPNWVKQEMKLSKDLKPVWSYIYDNENNVVVKVLFTKVDFAPVFDEEYFSVDSNMNLAKENISEEHVATSIEDLPLIPVYSSISSTLKEQTRVDDNGEVSYILTYEGEKSYTVFQTLLTKHKEDNYLSVNVRGDPVDTIYGFGSVIGKCLKYQYSDVSYEIYSKDLTVTEMINIVSMMERVNVK